MTAELLKAGYFYITKSIFKSKASLNAIGLMLWLNSHDKNFKPSVNFATNKTHICPNTYNKLLAEIAANENLSGNKKDSYVQIPRVVMRDERLSLHAKALFAYFWAYEKEGLPSTRSIANHLGISRTSYFKYNAELINAGYMQFKIGGGEVCNLKNQNEVEKLIKESSKTLFDELESGSKNESSGSDFGGSNFEHIRIRADLKNSNQHTRCSESNLENSKIASDFGLKILKFHFEQAKELLVIAKEIQTLNDLSDFNPAEQELIRDWFKHKRQRTGRKITAQNQKQDLERLRAWKADGKDLKFVISECINRSYQGLYLVEKKAPKSEWLQKEIAARDSRRAMFEAAMAELDLGA